MGQSQQLLNEKIDRIVARIVDLHLRKIANLGQAQNPNDAVPLSQVQSLIQKAINGIPAPAVQDIYCQQAQITGLRLGRGSAGTRVHVTDYCHTLYWDGMRFWFDGDDGSDFYVLRDDSTYVPDVGWHKADGSTVNFLKQDGTLGSKTLINSTTTPGYVSIGTGTGSFSVAVPPNISGSCSITFSSLNTPTVSGSCSVNSLSGTGSGVTIASSTSASGTTANSLTSSYSVGYSSATLASATVGGSISASVGGSATATAGNTGYANANLDSAYFSSLGGSASVSGTTDAGGGIGVYLGFSTNGTYAAFGGSDIPATTDVDDAITSSYVTVPGLTYSSGVTFSSFTVNGPAYGQTTHDHTGPSISVDTSGLTASIPGFTLYVNVPAVSISGLDISSGTLTHDHNFSLSSIIIPILTVDVTSISGSGSGTISGTCSGTVSGSISATADTSGTPNTYNMQLWYRQ